jgi:hypothetical protein
MYFFVSEAGATTWILCMTRRPEEVREEIYTVGEESFRMTELNKMH